MSQVSDISHFKSSSILEITHFYKKQNSPRLIAEIEMAPHDTATISLGTFDENDLPKGFLVEYNTGAENSKLVKTEVIAEKVSQGVQYLLQTTNDTNRAICVEVKVLY